MTKETLLQLLPIIAAFAAVWVSWCAVRESRKTAINGTYFSEMVSAYSTYTRCLSEFVFKRGITERDAMAVALYRTLLFAPDDIAALSQECYIDVLEWAANVSSPTPRAEGLDRKVNRLQKMMKADIDRFREKGAHQ